MDTDLKHTVIEGVMMLLIIAIIVKCFVCPIVYEKYDLKGDVNMINGDIKSFTTSSITFANDNAKKSFVSDLKAQINNIVYPVGSIYISYNSNDNPNKILGVGTWSQIMNDAYLKNTTSASNITKTGGSNSFKLSIAQLPSHNHEIDCVYDDYNYNHGKRPSRMSVPDDTSGATKVIRKTFYTSWTGSNAPIDKNPSYVYVRIWKRTA